ncbi:MAG: Fe-S cluster assembly ATPase SufC [Dehalococcoidia bacterium]|jgi:Fe-S cluster assembly ATP-binding protein|nr:Fe-S cluster assembly ATPase SufC [Dehalococcoidia bacterium]|tara:strand:+ start:1202 stop:1939 length:738 start_codon:yes stop_codon:yes gene_type:complete
MLEVKDLYSTVSGKTILNGVNLSIKPGEVHAIMGPNGSGKSTLSYTLAGKPNYIVDSGDILFEDQSIIEMLPETRAQLGIFLSFQHPLEIAGVRMDQFMRSAYNSIQKQNNNEELDVLKFNRLLKSKSEELNVDSDLIQRFVNHGFSGGERKKNEILQMAVLDPKLMILDEPDSGLDIDAVRSVADGINKLRSESKSTVIITHYQRILNYVIPDYVHIFMDGKIIQSGDKTLALQVEEKGYEIFN